MLKYEVEEPIASVLDSAAMKAYLQIFRLLWALKRAEHSLNDCWVDLNSMQRQLSAFPGFVRKSGLQSYSKLFSCCSHILKENQPLYSTAPKLPAWVACRLPTTDKPLLGLR